MKRITRLVLVLVAFGAVATQARAQDGDVEDAGPDEVSSLFHWPLSRIVQDGRPVRIAIEWQGSWSGRGVVLHHRSGGAGSYATRPFGHRTGARWEVEVPSSEVAVPTFEYWIESIESDGARVARFGSAGLPQVADVRALPSRNRTAQLLAGHKGYRSRVEASFRHYDFGRPGTTGERSQDSYNVFDLSYTYRLLSPGLYQVSLGVTLMGDRLGVDSPIYTRYSPGAYFGYLKAYWEFGDIFGVEPMLLIGASAEGFEGGGGLTARLGPVRATHFDLGFWGIRNLGWTVVTEFVWTGIPYVVVALRNEFTTFPIHARYGITPSIKLTGLLPVGIRVYGLIGYGIREGYDSGWLTWGVGVGWEF